MNHKNIELQVYINYLKIDLQYKKQLKISLFLSYGISYHNIGKKTNQIQKIKILHNQQNNKYYIQQSLIINYHQINIHKNKYCLLFIYQINQKGRKKIIGNLPINIINQNHNYNIYKLQDCIDINAEIQIQVKLKYQNQQDDCNSNKSSSLDKYAPFISKTLISKSKNCLSETNLNDDPNKKSRIYSIQTPNQTNKDYHSLKIRAATPTHQYSTQSIIRNTCKTLPNQSYFPQITEKPIKIISLESAIPQNQQQDSGLISSTSLIHTSNTPSSHFNDLNLIQNFGTFGRLQDGLITPRIASHQSKNNIHTMKIFDFIPQKDKKQSNLKINKVISLQYKGNSENRQQNRYLQQFLSKHPLSLDRQEAPNLQQINRHISTLEQKYNGLMYKHEKCVSQNIQLKQLIWSNRRQYQKQSQFYHNTVQQLAQKLRISQQLCQQYFQIIQAKQHKINQVQSNQYLLLNQNNILKEQVKQNTKIIQHLRQQINLYYQAQHNIKSKSNYQPAIHKYPKHNLQIDIDNNTIQPNIQSEDHDRISSKTLQNFYDTKRNTPQQQQIHKSKLKPGTIISNKSRIAPITPYSENAHSTPNSNYTNQSGGSKQHNHFSQILMRQSDKIDRKVSNAKKGYIIDYLQIQKKNLSASGSRLQHVEKYQGKTVSSKDNKRQYFMNRKYIKLPQQKQK